MPISPSPDTGPVLTAPYQGALLGAGAVLVWNDVAATGREQFYNWHDKEHIPERLAIPGFCRGRRYISPGHSPEWLTLNEADDIDVLVSPEYLRRLNSPTSATVSTLRYFANTSRAVCSVAYTIGSSNGGHMLALRLDVPATHAEAMRDFLKAEVFPDIFGLVGVVACHLYAANQPASHLDTAESSTRAFDVPSWVLLVEATNADAAQKAHGQINAAGLQRFDAVVRQDAAVYALEICRRSSPEAAL